MVSVPGGVDGPSGGVIDHGVVLRDGGGSLMMRKEVSDLTREVMMLLSRGRDCLLDWLLGKEFWLMSEVLVWFTVHIDRRLMMSS